MNEATNGFPRVVEYKGCAIDPVSNKEGQLWKEDNQTRHVPDRVLQRGRPAA
jgi:hypothetical protein